MKGPTGNIEALIRNCRHQPLRSINNRPIFSFLCLLFCFPFPLLFVSGANANILSFFSFLSNLSAVDWLFWRRRSRAWWLWLLPVLFTLKGERGCSALLLKPSMQKSGPFPFLTPPPLIDFHSLSFSFVFSFEKSEVLMHECCVCSTERTNA